MMMIFFVALLTIIKDLWINSATLWKRGIDRTMIVCNFNYTRSLVHAYNSWFSTKRVKETN